MAETSPTQEEFAGWMRLSEAVNAVQAQHGSQAHNSIMRRLKEGLIRSYAENCAVDDKPVQGLTILSQMIWDDLGDKDGYWRNPVWVTNDLDITVYANGYPTRYRFYGVRVEPGGIQKMIAPRQAPRTLDSLRPRTPQKPAPAPSVPTSPPPAQASQPSRGGRPPKDFWEDMVIAATRAILYDDTLKPKTIADVQRWMAEWAIANGHGDPGETALKERARKVFLACQD